MFLPSQLSFLLKSNFYDNIRLDGTYWHSFLRTLYIHLTNLFSYRDLLDFLGIWICVLIYLCEISEDSSEHHTYISFYVFHFYFFLWRIPFICALVYKTRNKLGNVCMAYNSGSLPGIQRLTLRTASVISELSEVNYLCVGGYVAGWWRYVDGYPRGCVTGWGFPISTVHIKECSPLCKLPILLLSDLN
jgi:hypothetical protein